ncbi:MAG: molybdopterin cofactor-binding domain-containing protein [Pseudomonadota bacterium]
MRQRAAHRPRHPCRPRRYPPLQPGNEQCTRAGAVREPGAGRSEARRIIKPPGPGFVHSQPGTLHMRLVRALDRCGRIRELDADAARAVQGVHAVWTAGSHQLPDLPIRFASHPDLEARRQPLLATGTVRYVGEPVAAVFAESPAIAEDAAERVTLELIPPHAEAWKPWGGNVSLSRDDNGERITIRKSYGDLNLAFHHAERIVEERITVAPRSPLTLIPRIAQARPDGPSGRLEVLVAHRSIHATRAAVAAACGMPEHAVLVRRVPAAGNFGTRGELSPEDLLVCLAAHQLKRPVVWREDRAEQLAWGPSAPGFEAFVRGAVGEDGTLSAIDVEFLVDQGAYARAEGLFVAELISALVPAPCQLAAYRATGHTLFTPRPPAAAVDGAGRVEANLIRERLFDAISVALGENPLLARAMFYGPPRPRPAARHHRENAAVGMDRDENAEAVGGTDGGSAGFGPLLTQASRQFSLPALRRRVSERRAGGELVGLGAAFFAEPVAASEVSVRLSMDRGGNVCLQTPIGEDGQGTTKGLAQVVSSTLSVDVEAVTVRCASTSDGARGALILPGRLAAIGAACVNAAEALRQRLASTAADAIGVPTEHLLFQSGRVRGGQEPSAPSFSISELAQLLAGDSNPGFELVVEGRSDGGPTDLSLGITFAVVVICRETGMVQVPKVLVAGQSGRLVNPRLARAAVEAGAIRGTEAALLPISSGEELGRPSRHSLASAGLLGARQHPQVDIYLSENVASPLGPSGVGPVGGAGIAAVGAAIASGVDQALGIPGFASSLPVAPSKIMTALRQRSGRSPGIDQRQEAVRRRAPSRRVPASA